MRLGSTVKRWAGRLSIAVVLMTTVAARARTMESGATTRGAGAGVSRALAEDRAGRVTAVRYGLRIVLRPHASVMPGEEQLRFTLSPAGADRDLPLDYREGAVHSVVLNGKELPPTAEDGHLLLKHELLRPGENVVELTFDSRVAQSGAAITRYEDKDDGSEYMYSLFVPMDASMAFPCFDQPDLKARFTLSVEAPADWAVIGNTAAERDSTSGATVVSRFAETRPIPTYLFAFAAGPWVSVAPRAGMPNVFVRRSQVKRATPEVPQLQEITARGMRWLADYFQQPFPFPKYDIVLIPGFPFGGMEHAGATFLREDGVLFRTAPTASDLFQRNILTLHELTHQWFGDLVTMRWFDDLWLKEGFAQYMAYKALDALAPDSQAWKHFYEDIKPQAYAIDETQGTTPIFQQVPNLKDAKSAYGAIVYEKAPSILKQLDFWLGADNFRAGLRLYLKDHAYANAQWSELVDALHEASGKDVRGWADAWVLRRGMPEIDVTWSCKAARLSEVTLKQHDVLPDEYVWPMSNDILLGYPGSKSPIKLSASWNGASHTVYGSGQPCPEYVFANFDDYAYGRFLLDAKSEAAIRRRILSGALQAGGTQPLLRSLLWGALWENVHVAKTSPRSYMELVLRDLPHEQDETLARIQGVRAATAMHRYMSAQARSEFAAKVEHIAKDRMLNADSPGLRIISFRTLTSVAETPSGLATLAQLLDERIAIPEVQLRPLDRWNLVGRLIAQDDKDAQEYFAREQRRDNSGDGQKYAWAVQAGFPEAASKERYFAAYLVHPGTAAARPEDWLTQSLRPFNSWNQDALTRPYLSRALDELPEIKRDRKIFFLGAWLQAFIGGQRSAESEEVVDQWLTRPGIDPDLRLKVLENVDELRRTVLIRRTFPN